jgi:large subunit ribosomal protein L30
MNRKCLSVIRVRGVSDVEIDVKETLKMLKLFHNYHCTIFDNRPAYIGMLQKAHHYITWGEPSIETILLLLKKRGRTFKNQKITDEHARKLGYDSLDKLAEALFNMDIQLKDLKYIKPVFRLHPPKKGFKGTIKRSYKSGGVTGYRGEDINNLIKCMS